MVVVQETEVGPVKTLDIYIRVSRIGGRDGDSFQSPGDQERTTRAAIEARGWQVGEVNKIDLDASGGTVERDGFQRILTRIETRQVDGIAVIRLDRFARSVLIAWQTLERIDKADGILFSATEQLDFATPAGKQQFSWLAGNAQYWRDLSIENWEKSKANAAERGVYIGPTPVGYKRTGMSRGKPAGPMVPDLDSAPHIKEVFRRRAQGETLTALAAYLSEHVESRGDRWSGTSVRKILDNRAYRGELRHGDLFNPKAHPPLVTEAEWRAANATRGTRRLKAVDFLLTGFVRCAGCGYKMRPQPQGERRYYRCGSHASAGRCPARASINAGPLERWVQFHVFERHEDVTMRDVPDVDVEATALALREAESAYAAVAQMVAESSRPDLLIAAVNDAERRVQAAEAAHAEAQGVGEHGSLPGLFSMRELWGDWSLEDQRQAIAAILDFVALRGAAADGRPLGERAHIFWRGTAPEGLPTPGKFIRPQPIDWPERTAGMSPAENVRDGVLERPSLSDKT